MIRLVEVGLRISLCSRGAVGTSAYDPTGSGRIPGSERYPRVASVWLVFSDHNDRLALVIPLQHANKHVRDVLKSSSSVLFVLEFPVLDEGEVFIGERLETVFRN